MCGRFNLTDSPEVISLMASLGFNTDGLTPRVYQDKYNIAPTEAILVAGEEGGVRFLREMRWWLTPHWAPEVSTKYSMFNARAETLHRSRAFRTSFQRRRCVIPASGFIEWRKEPGGKQPYYIQPPTQFCFFAGLWDRWEREDKSLESCTIITTESGPDFQALHHRTPVFLNPEQFSHWLDADTSLEQLEALFQPQMLADWRCAPLDRIINNGREKTRAATSPIGDEVLLEEFTW